MSSNTNRSKEICRMFINFLFEKNVIENNEIEKEEARKIYQDAFKPSYSIKAFSFSKLRRCLWGFNLIQHNRTKLIFKPHNIRKLIDKKPPAASTDAVTKVCSICQITLSEGTSFDNHKKTDKHLLLNKYSNDRKTLLNPIPNLNIEIVEGHGGLAETIVLGINEKKEVTLKLINNTGNNYCITEVFEIIRSPSITIAHPSYPVIIPANNYVWKINVCFNQTTYASYPVIFRLKNLQSNQVTDVLKELDFHAHSNAVDDLHARGTYKKTKASPVVIPLVGVVRGEHMKKSDNDFKPAIILPQFQLSDCLLELFNNGLNDFDGMTSNHKRLLREIRTLLQDFKFKYGQILNEKNYYEMLRLLLFMEEYQMKVDIKKYSLDGHPLIRSPGLGRNCLKLEVPGLSEHRPSLLRGDSVYVMESKSNSVQYEGIVHKVQQDGVVLGFSHKFMNKVHIDNKKYYITFGFNRVTVRAEHQAINLLHEHRAISILCKNTNFTPKVLKSHQLVWFNKNIANNPQQQQAVQNILSQSSRPMPYIVFGPPGTGKTVTIVEAVLQVWKMLPTKHVLVCAPSNSAANEVTKRLVEIVPKTDLFRYVAPSYPYELIYDKIKPFINYNNDDYYHPANTTLLTYRIVVTTLVNASRLVNGGTPKGHFEYVFIDESGQATESETLIPISGILTSITTLGAICGQIVLAGDPKQLGPIIHSQEAIRYGFDISMLERLMKDIQEYQKTKDGKYNENLITKLVHSYRSHPAILEVPNKLFYDRELIPAANVCMTHIAEGWEHLPNPKFPVIFHSVSGKDQREQNSPSFFNVEEIDVVLYYLNLLIGTKLSGMKIYEKHIGIIAPYRKQVQKLQQACAKKKYGHELFIGSVEQFQGQERHIIILTTVRCKPEYTRYDTKFHLGFLNNPKRFNVAITRPKALLIVIGNPNILMMDPHWHAFIKHCKDNNSIGGAPFTLETAFNVSELMAVISALEIDDPALNNDTEEGPNFSRGRI